MSAICQVSAPKDIVRKEEVRVCRTADGNGATVATVFSYNYLISFLIGVLCYWCMFLLKFSFFTVAIVAILKKGSNINGFYGNSNGNTMATVWQHRGGILLLNNTFIVKIHQYRCN